MVTCRAAGAATHHPPSHQCPAARRRGVVHPAALRPPSLAAPASSVAPAPSPPAPPAASLSNLINSPQGDPLPPAAGPQAQTLRGDGGTPHGAPRAHGWAHGSPAPRESRDCRVRDEPPEPSRDTPACPRPPSPVPRSPGPCSTPRLALCLCTQSLRASPAVGSSKALPLLNSSIIDIVAEPPGAGGWQRYYLHLSSFPSPPPFPGRLKSREIRRRKAASSSSPAPRRRGDRPDLPVPRPTPPRSRPCPSPSLSPSPSCHLCGQLNCSGGWAERDSTHG